MNPDDDTKQNRKFGYVVGSAFLSLSVFHIFIRHHHWWWGLFAAGSALLILAYVKPVLLGPLCRVWDKIGHVLGIINTYVLLTLFYLLILTPLGLIMRLLGKDILKLKQNKQDTYWESALPDEGSGMENQF